MSATSSWVNIDVVDYKEVNSAANTAFSFLNESVYDLAKFDIVLINSKREPIQFAYTEKKIPQVNFTIGVLKKMNNQSMLETLVRITQLPIALQNNRSARC